MFKRKISIAQAGGVCALLGLALLILIVKGSAQSAPVSPFGMNSHLGLRFRTEFMADAVKKLSNAGVTWAREEFLWYNIDPDPGSALTDPLWQGAGFDYLASMQQLHAAQINVVGLLTYGPNKDVITGKQYEEKDQEKDEVYGCPKADPNAASIDAWLPEWEEYVRVVVDKFGDQIDVWEIQNEENEVCFWRKVDKRADYPNAVEYVKVLKAAQAIIKAKDPNDRVILGGLCPNDLQTTAKCFDYYEYTTMVADAGGWPYFDILAFHPYRTPSPPEEVLIRSKYNVEALDFTNQEAYNLMDEINQFRKLMEHWGQKPLWISELGYSSFILEKRAEERANICQVLKNDPTGPKCCQVKGWPINSEIVQADYLIRSYIQAIAAGVENIQWYDFRDDANLYDKDDNYIITKYELTPTSKNVADKRNEASYGIIQFSHTPKQAYYAFGAMAHLLEGSRFVAQVRGQDDRWSSGPDIHEYRFERGAETIIALWKSRDGDQCQAVQVTEIFSDRVTLYGPHYSSTLPAPEAELPVVAGTVSLELTERPVFLVYRGGQVLGSQATPSLPAPITPTLPWTIPTVPPNFNNSLDQFLADPLGWLMRKLNIPTQQDMEKYLLNLVNQALKDLLTSLNQSCSQCLGGLTLIGGGVFLARRRKRNSLRSLQ